MALSPRRHQGWLASTQGRRDQWPLLVTTVVILVVVGITVWQLGGASALLSNTTTTGGDTGAHYIVPHYLSTFLDHGHLTGWFPGWYDGMPLYTYYFILPDLLTVFGTHLVGYNVAFKLSTVLGSLLLPLCAWALGRGFGLRRPFPEVLAVFTLPFLFEQSYTIDGGNLFSTLAGEYAFSLSLSLVLLFLGLCAHGLRTKRNKLLAPLVLATALAAHLLPVLYGLSGLGLLALMELIPSTPLSDDGMGWARGIVTRRRSTQRDRLDRLGWLGVTLGIGLGLMAWWLVPFVAFQKYANPMGYTNISIGFSLYAPTADLWVVVLAVVTAVLGFTVRSRFAIFATVMTVVWGVAVAVDPQGSIYNARLLPMYIVSLYLSGAWSFSYGAVRLATAWRRYKLGRFATAPLSRRRPSDVRYAPGSITGAIVALVVVGGIVVSQFDPVQTELNKVLPASLQLTPPANQVANWASYNYAGYEGRGLYYDELNAIINLANEVGAQHGCGRMMWEYEPSETNLGTTEALMDLPLWTHDCIDTQEGLFFESSATTPYHFLNQAQLSTQPSMAQVGLPYGSTDVADGLRHLQVMGVRYYLAFTPSLVAAAAKFPGATLVGQTPALELGGSQTTTWKVFELADADVVSPLSHLPVVEPGIDASSASWISASVPWYQDVANASVPLAASGPKGWPRGGSATSGARVLQPTVVSHVVLGRDTVSFHSSRLGVPVLVKVSYFPAWHATGALGPYRVTPNFMVVVPTSHDVTLRFTTTSENQLGTAISWLSLVALLVLAGLLLRRRRGQPGVPNPSRTA